MQYAKHSIKLYLKPNYSHRGPLEDLINRHIHSFSHGIEPYKLLVS